MIIIIERGVKMNKLFTIILLFFTSMIISNAAISGHHKVTFQYGGEWVDTTIVANGDFFSMVGVFVGTNEMVDEAGGASEEVTGIFDDDPMCMHTTVPVSSQTEKNGSQ